MSILLLVFVMLMTLMPAGVLGATLSPDEIHIVAGDYALCGSIWDPSDSNNLMTYLEDDGCYYKTYENVNAGTYNFKVTTNGCWDAGDYNLNGSANHGGSNATAVVAEDGSTVIIGFNGEKATLEIIPPGGGTVNDSASATYSYAYDARRRPYFPSSKDAEITLSNFDKPLRYGAELGNSNNYYASSEGEWTLTEVGTYSEKSSFNPSPSEYFEDVISEITSAYSMNDSEKEELIIHKLTDIEDTLVGYGVVVSIDETNGYALFISDVWNDDGASYFLSQSEITVDSIILNKVINTYDVSFDANGHGTAPDTISDIEEGSIITAPSAPVAEGYTFGGWYKEASCVNEWDFENDTVTKNTTLYAKWEETNQPITYKEYHILTDDLEHVQTVLDDVAEVTEITEGAGDEEIRKIVIKLTNDVYGRIWFGVDDSDYGSSAMHGNFVIDLGGKTIDAGAEKNEAICLDNNFAGKAIITGEGILKKGRNNIIYCNDYEEVWFDVAEGKDYFILKLEDENLYPETEKHTEAKAFDSNDTWGGDTLTLIQGVFETYTVTFDANGGSVSPENASTEADGKLATLPTPTRSDLYTFNGWYTDANGGTQITVDTVYTEDTTIYAQWTYTGSTGGGSVNKYTIRFETNGGTTIANKSVTRNAKLEEPTAPKKDGFKFDGWYTDKDLTIVYDFNTKVTKNFKLYAKWDEADSAHVCSSEKFTDLDKTKWYYEDIEYVIDNNIMLGTSETVFSPEESLTRGMLVTILYRSEGEPTTNKSIPFADVDMGAYYANATSWAQQNGIIKGISEKEFAPHMDVTREQLATIMFRYAQFKGVNAITTEENLHFKDTSSISKWAVAAMNWSVGQNYIFSRNEGDIIPDLAATRAEIAAFIHRFIESNN